MSEPGCDCKCEGLLDDRVKDNYLSFGQIPSWRVGKQADYLDVTLPFSDASYSTPRAFGFVNLAATGPEGSVSLSVSGLVGSRVVASASRAVDPQWQFSRSTQTTTLKLDDKSQNVISENNSISIRLDSCTIGDAGDVLLTASAACPVGVDVSAVPMSLADLASVGAGFKAYAGGPDSSEVEGLYWDRPPEVILGNRASSFSIYRDGSLVTSFTEPDTDKSTLSVTAASGGGAVTIGNQNGTCDDPIAIERTGEDTSWSLSVTPAVSGTIVAVYRTFEASSGATISRGVLRYSSQAGTPVTVAVPEKKEHFSDDDPPAGGLPIAPQRRIVAEIVRLYSMPDMGVHRLSQEVIEACSPEGSYLVVAKHEGSYTTEMASDRDSSGFVGSTLMRHPTPLVNYASFCVLSTNYAYAMKLEDDRWQGESEKYSDSDGTWPCDRENPFPHRVFVTTAGPTTPYLYPSPDVQLLPVPVYPLTTAGVPTATVHPVPSSGKRGARARFVVRENGAEPFRLIRDRPLVQVPLNFDKPVTGITADMVTVAGYVPPDGEPDTVAVEQLRRVTGSLQQYIVTLAAQKQVANSMWTVTFTPGNSIGVLSTSVQIRQFANQAAFPAEGEAGVVYLDDSTGDDYVWSLTGYRRPGGADCDEWGTTKLAARYMWALGRDKSIGRFCADTKTDADRTMPSRASLSKTFTVTAAPTGPETIVSATGGVTVAVQSNGLLSAPVYPLRSDLMPARVGPGTDNLCAFLPQMPPSHATGPTGPFSYFGVPTTIHPAPPRWLGECCSPSVHQRHASLLFRADDVSGWSVTLPDFLILPNGFIVNATEEASRVVLVSRWLGLGRKTFAVQPKIDVSGQQFTLQSNGTPQNFWNFNGSMSGTNVEDYRHDGFPILQDYSHAGYSYVQSETQFQQARVGLCASRGRLTYRALRTTTVTELVLNVSIQVSGRWRYRERAPNGDPLPWDSWQAWKNFSAPAWTYSLIVPPSLEEAFGQLEDRESRMWTLTPSSPNAQ